MPAKNIVKEYLENGYYHIYNRGVEKRNIFLDEQDCKVFLHYLKMYLSPVEELNELAQPGVRIHRFIPLNLSKEIDLLAFTLMPNHFHLEIKQYTANGMNKLLQRLLTGYVTYFNKKYKRVGTLFQGTYKAVLIKSEAQFLHLSRYIHLNSKEIVSPINFSNFSSYPYYLGYKNASWIKPEEILNYFTKDVRKEFLSYKNFIEAKNVNSAESLRELVIEED